MDRETVRNRFTRHTDGSSPDQADAKIGRTGSDKEGSAASPPQMRGPEAGAVLSATTHRA